MDVSIIIVNYNTTELTLNCVKSLYDKIDNISFEVIVVDNASNESPLKSIQKKFPKVKVVESKENLGFGKANNLGAKEAIGKYLLFLNSDTLFLNNAITYFLSFATHNTHLKLGAIGSILLDQQLKPTHSSNCFPSKRNVLKIIFAGYFDKNAFSRNLQEKEKLMSVDEEYFCVDYVTGADLFIEKELFLKIEGFDKDYFMYYEETDLQMRLKKLGYRSVVIKGPKIIHLEGGSFTQPIYSVDKRIIVTKSMFTYFKKYSNFLSYKTFRILYFILRLPILFDQRISLKDKVKYFSFLLGSKFI